MLKKETKRVTADVLVIGSGMAGLRAAIEARRAGLDVLLVDKSVLGRASSSVYAGGLGLEIIPKHLPYHGASEEKKFADYFNGTIEDIFQKMVTEGVSIGWGYPYIDNQRILMTVASDYKLRQEELGDFGVEDPYSQHFIGRARFYGRAYYYAYGGPFQEDRRTHHDQNRSDRSDPAERCDHGRNWL